MRQVAPEWLVYVIADLWKTAAAEAFFKAPSNPKILQTYDRLLKRRERWPRANASFAIYFPPRRAKLAVAPRWWQRIDAQGWAIEVVADEADPLTEYGRNAPAWAAAVREIRPNVMLHALSQLFEDISTGVIRLEGIRHPLATDAHQQIPVAALRQRAWSFNAGGILTVNLPGIDTDPTHFFEVRIAAVPGIQRNVYRPANHPRTLRMNPLSPTRRR